jgi:hypothetical protein
MCSISKKKIKYIEINKDSHLPKNGWIQACIWCRSLTSKKKFYKKIETNYKDYMLFIYYCKDCKKNKILENEDSVDKINTYIYNNYSIPG